MYNGPPRPGPRGGRGDFTWDSVKSDKDREYYLGHSVKALAGRWQKNKDVYWYTRDKDAAAQQIRDELQAVKQREEQLMQEALGLRPKAVTTMQPMDQKELETILRKNAQQDELDGTVQAPEDPGAVRGLGFAKGAAGVRTGSTGHTVTLEVGGRLQGEGLSPPPGLPSGSVGAAGQAQARSQAQPLPGPPPLPDGKTAGALLLSILASGVALSSEQIKQLAKHDKKAAKQAKKARKKAKKEAKRASKEARKRGRARHDSSSSSSDGSSDSEAPASSLGQQAHAARRQRHDSPDSPPANRHPVQQPGHHRDEKGGAPPGRRVEPRARYDRQDQGHDISRGESRERQLDRHRQHNGNSSDMRQGTDRRRDVPSTDRERAEDLRLADRARDGSAAHHRDSVHGYHGDRRTLPPRPSSVDYWHQDPAGGDRGRAGRREDVPHRRPDAREAGHRQRSRSPGRQQCSRSPGRQQCSRSPGRQQHRDRSPEGKTTVRSQRRHRSRS